MFDVLCMRSSMIAKQSGHLMLLSKIVGATRLIAGSIVSIRPPVSSTTPQAVIALSLEIK